MYSIHIFLIISAICGFCDPAKILAVFPAPFFSHQVVFRTLTQELVKRGHEVVVITTDPAFSKGKAPENLTEIYIHDISYKAWSDEVLSRTVTTGKSEDVVSQTKLFLPTLSKIFEIQMMTDQVKQVMDNSTNHFDVILVEACVRPAISVSHVFKVPVIVVSSFAGIVKNYDVMGAPMRPPLQYPTVFRQKIYNMSFWDKFIELYHHYLFEYFFYNQVEYENEMVKRLFGPDTPTIQELENNVHLMLLNVHPIWDSNRPVPPSVVYMGGVHQSPSKELPEELKSYLDASKHGVIYISFGSNMDPASLPPERIQLLVRVFSKLPYDVLWKWSQDELPGRTENIRISKWWPQSDLLKHPKVKLFITQGGLHSTDEAITAGVPLIGMPMLGDQWYNVEQYVHHKIGLWFDLGSLTEEALLDGINTIVRDDSFRKNVEKLRSVMHDQPEKPLDRAVWWTEHVIRHGGGPHLRARVANMSWAEYLDVQFMATLALLLITAVAALSVALCFVVCLIRKYVSTGNKLKSS